MLKKLWGTMLAVTLVSTSLMGCSTETAKPAATEAAAQASEEKTAAPAAETPVGETGAKASEDGGEKKLKIGFSESTYSGAWRVAEVEDVTKYAEMNGYELIMTNADSNIEKQIGDVEDLIAQKCDLIVIVPVDANAVAPAFEACKSAGIPVIDMDTQYLDGKWKEDFITTIRSDQYQQGQGCAEWTVGHVGDKDTTVLEITGNPGQSDAQNRSRGFNEYVADHSNIKVIQQNGEWSRATAQEVVQNVAQSGQKFDVIYCHSDEMALGALLGLKQAGLKPNEDVWIVAVDGQKEALDAIKADEIGAIITCTPKGGDVLFDCINKYFAGDELEEEYFVHQSTITTENVDELYEVEGF